MAVKLFPKQEKRIIECGTSSVSPPRTPPKSGRIKVKDDPDSPWLQAAARVPLLRDPNQERLKKIPGEVKVEVWSCPYALVEEYSEMAEMHIDQRVAHFFLQALLCHDMPFHFEDGPAEIQFGEGHRLKLSQIGGQDQAYQAAHPSTHPTLYACKLSDWEEEEDPDCFVYLPGSEGENLQNTTNTCPKIFNECDSKIDFQSGGEKFRDTSIKLINKVALRELDPTKATGRFVTSLINRIKYLLAQSSDDRVKAVLEKYLSCAQEIAAEVNEEDFYDRLLSLNIENDDRASRLRQAVYPKVYEIIREGQLLGSEIDGLLNGCDIKFKRGESKDLLKFALVMRSEGKLKEFLAGHFCLSTSVLDIGYFDAHIESDHKLMKPVETEGGRKVRERKEEKDRKRHLAFIARVRQFNEVHGDAIRALLDGVAALILKHEKAEQKYRAVILKDLIYKVNETTQKAFVENFREKYTDESMSEAMVSRLTEAAREKKPGKVYKTPISQRTKKITVEKAIKMADILKVSPGIFFRTLQW